MDQTSPTRAAEPSTQLAPGRRRWVLIGCMAIMFMTAVEGSIIATAMPSIVAELGGYHHFAWAFSAYLLAQAVTIPIYGRLSDLYGRKRVFFVGASFFALGSLACGFAPSMIALILARAVQGLGAGGIMPIGQTIIGDVYSPTERSKIQGYLSSMWGISAVIGPLIGAFIVEQLSWPLVFWFNIPLAIAVMVLLSIVLPENMRRAAHSLDVAGALLLVVAIGSLMLVLLQGAQMGPTALGVGAVSLVAFALFAWQETRAVEPLLPFVLWRDKVLRTCISGSLFIGATSMGVTAFLPTYVQGVMGRSAFIAGGVLAALSIGWPVAATIAGQLMNKTSYRLTATTGGCLLVVGALILTQINHFSGVAYATMGSFVIGMGLGMCNSPFMVAVQDASAWSVRGIATASNTFLRMVGAGLGAALMSGVLNLTLASRGGLATDAAEILVDPERRAALAPDRIAELAGAVADGITFAFTAAVFLACAVVAIALNLPPKAKPGQLAQRGQN